MRQYQLIIGNKNYSSWSLRAWLVMKFAALDFACETLPLSEPETIKRLKNESPNNRVPYLQVEDLVLSESLAIAEYIADLYPKKKLWPADLDARAEARSICCRMASGFFAIRNEMPLNVRRKNKEICLTDDALREIEEVEALILNARRKYAFNGSFLFGERSIADAFYAPVMLRFASYVNPKKFHPDMQLYMKTIFSLPEIQGWQEMAAHEPWTIQAAEK